MTSLPRTPVRRGIARGVFVTGTDTGVGKTIVAVALARSFVSYGLRVAVMKPVASGSERGADGLRNQDAMALLDASNVVAPYETVNPFCFEPPISPHIAAKEAGVAIDLGRIRNCFETLADGSDYVIVEGAGGWLAPIDDQHAMADLAAALEIPAVLVVGLRLGCLNHARLTQRAIESQGTGLAGWIANGVDPTIERAAENLATLKRSFGEAPLAVVPFMLAPLAAAPDLSGAARELRNRLGGI